MLSASAPGPHTVYVYDPAVFSVVNKLFVVDGDRRAIVGMVDSGWLANLVLLPQDSSRFYLVETYFSRFARGERSDVVTVYDSRRLSPIREIPLPEGRMLVAPKVYNAGVTPDGRYLLSFNMSPATSVSVVDLQTNQFLRQIETPGCFYVYPSGPNRFYMHCSDGTLLSVTFDAQGRATTRRSSAFHPQDDYIFDNSPFIGGRLYALSYEGNVYPIDLSGEQPNFGERWSLLKDQDRAESWRPGGWQIAAVHARTNRLYVLMHQGPEWTHKQPGSEVWVYDLATRQRIDRFVLAHPADSIAVSQDDRPQLYAVSAHEKLLQFYDATTGRFLGQVDELGHSPMVLAVAR